MKHFCKYLGHEITKSCTPQRPSNSLPLSIDCLSFLNVTQFCFHLEFSTRPTQLLRRANSWPDSTRSIHGTITGWPIEGTTVTPCKLTPHTLSPITLPCPVTLQLSIRVASFSSPLWIYCPSAWLHCHPSLIICFLPPAFYIHLPAPAFCFPSHLHFTPSSLNSCHLTQMEVSGQQ